MKEAMYYEKKEGRDKAVQCFLCPHHCIIAPGKTGLCQVRQNRDGVLYSLNYGRVSSFHMDPIEKKPLYHFYPGTWIMSLGTLGCNFSCSFCQNASISQLPRGETDSYFRRLTEEVTPEEIGEVAVKSQKRGSIGIAYTYNEPSIWFEYVLECSKEVKKRGLKNVLVTNGYLEIEPLKQLLPYVDAANVDLKAIDDSFYKKLCGGRLDPVLEYLKIAKQEILIEVTNLIVTGENDSEEKIKALVDWVSENLGRDTPLHFSRYHPDYRFDSPATSVKTLARAYEIAIEKLDYVYVGNVWGGSWDSTRCPSCHKVVVDRSGYQLREVNLKDRNKCKFCGAEVAVVTDVT